MCWPQRVASAFVLRQDDRKEFPKALGGLLFLARFDRTQDHLRIPDKREACTHAVSVSPCRGAGGWGTRTYEN